MSAFGFNETYDKVPMREVVTAKYFRAKYVTVGQAWEQVASSASLAIKNIVTAKQVQDRLRLLQKKWRSAHLLQNHASDFHDETNNAKQKHFEVLCQENAALLTQLENVWHRARLRRNGQAGFELELFVYVPKPEAQATSLRRATAARIQEQMPRVAAFVRERQIEAGEASQRYMAVTQARLPDGAPLAVPDSTTFRQLQHIDAPQAAIDRATDAEQQRADSEYCMVRVKLHSVPVPLEVNVVDLRAALGLPSYSLRPPFRPPTDIETPGLAMDIPDEEHTDERTEAMEN
ncbi:hypothetical protein ON010_g13909 [Phytophthora cinnamomi]|nr:hypothetical protein ON010_g13909 [Phytophthora cinnamomi]